MLFWRLYICILLTVLFCVAGAGKGEAEGWSALVIGNPGAGAEHADEDAARAARALVLGGADEVTLLRSASKAEVDGAVATLNGVQNLIIYIAAPNTDGQFALKTEPLDATLTLKYLGLGGTQNVAFLYENCAGDGTTPQGFVDLSEAVNTTIWEAASAGPGAHACPARGQRLTDRLSAPTGARTLQTLLSSTYVKSNPDFPQVPLTTVSDTDLPGVAQTVSVVSDDVVSLAPSVKMVKLNRSDQEQLQPVSLNPAQVPVVNDGVVIFNVPPEEQIAATPVIKGKPTPYIILGVIKKENAESLPKVETTIDLAKVEFVYSDVDERRAFRKKDPEMFEKLVTGGALDPPQSKVATALQTELHRMGCYTAKIDGVWGTGSRSSVERYFKELKESGTIPTDPSIGLFRQILLKDDIACPAPVASVQPSARRGSGGRSGRRGQRRVERTVIQRQVTGRGPRADPPEIQIRTAPPMGVYR